MRTGQSLDLKSGLPCEWSLPCWWQIGCRVGRVLTSELQRSWQWGNGKGAGGGDKCRINVRRKVGFTQRRKGGKDAKIRPLANAFNVCEGSFLCVFATFASLRETDFRERLFQPVVGRFLRDDHVVNVRLAQAGGSNANELTLILKFLDCATPCVAHSRTQAAH